ncbi:DUF6126 family protein [Streptomyces goshikiensis]|uniref:DUF6126 family protein n=1 Tax=Streptomyces goshikiensis TaxID=1942 RepID=UPI0036BBA59B
MSVDSAEPVSDPAVQAGAPEAGPEAVPAAAPGVRKRIESKFPRGLVIRLIAYLFVGHLFAFFVYLLFVLGGQNQ